MEKPMIISDGIQYWDEFEEGGVRWVLLQCCPHSDDELIEIFMSGASYGGPGQYFQQKPHIKRTKRRVLMTQRFGLDV
ncbi:hypothetical protein DSCO28_73020 (plasmid) [Desulfosarcina ovata subsp. sediminis]|uniref:Uncharacterized protein n=1 Tax=Desulfosarcina ovata subsp. sediminis TaxID=885957 RepID=A0A5K8A2R5_9BACT|nr:hypothetical protein [Desulfosarcina ovata]BBO86736.1 hypothetical protein DSCO28_73020 [Desulfosarcina ovata subsp. sediminis]